VARLVDEWPYGVDRQRWYDGRVGRQVLTLWVWIVLAAAVGCRSELNPAYCAAHADPRCGNGGSDATDSGSDLCFGAGAYKVCVDALPMNTLVISTDIDTSPASSLCAITQPVGWVEGGQPAACFVIAKTLSIANGNNVNATGPRPLVLLGSESLSIDDELTLVGVHDAPQTIPAGYDAAACTTTPAPGNDTSGAGGGAGGSLSTKGGDGGAGAGGGGTAGLAIEVVTPALLRGGCPGQTGGNGDQAGGPGGNGGGAVYLVSRAITLGANARIAVSGAGGSGALHHGGGGGGGSAGMIVMYGNMLTVNTSAVLIANGGGGGSGGNGGNGARGNDPSTSSPTSVATGGTMGGGHGGNGYAGGVAATMGLTASGSGGGGGGGGAGFILANQTIGAMTSPVPVVFSF